MRRLLRAALAVSLVGSGAVLVGAPEAGSVSGSPQVIACYKAPESSSLRVRYRSFANTGGDEVYLGRPNLGVAANRVAQQLSWAQNADNNFSLTLDRANDRLISTVGSNTPLYYPSAAGGLAALLAVGALDNLNIAQITVKAGDVGTSVSLKDLAVDGTPVDADPSAAGVQAFTAVEAISPNFRDWMLTGLDFADPAGWTITGKIALSGTYTNSQENSRVEIAFGKKTDPTVSVSGDATVVEGTNPSASYTVSVAGTLYSNVSVDYATVAGTASDPDDYTGQSGTLTIDACTALAPSATVTVPIVDDLNGELNETFTFGISNPVGATLGSPSSVVTTIVDTDVINAAPVASPASASTPEDLPVAISPTVFDADGNPTTVSVVSGPSNGSVVVSGPGTFTYTPGANFTGVDTFTYKANDGLADSNVAMITVTVTPVVAPLPKLAVSTVTPPRVTNPGVLPGGAPVTVTQSYTITRSGSAAALNRLSSVQWRTNPSATNPATGCGSVPALNTGTPACNFVTVAPTTVTFMPGETIKTVVVTIVGAPTVPKSGLNYRVELLNPYKTTVSKPVHTMRITRT